MLRNHLYNSAILIIKSRNHVILNLNNTMGPAVYQNNITALNLKSGDYPKTAICIKAKITTIGQFIMVKIISFKTSRSFNGKLTIHTQLTHSFSDRLKASIKHIIKSKHNLFPPLFLIYIL